MIPQDLQDAVVAELTELFQNHRRQNSMGVSRAISVYAQSAPIREGDDEGRDKEAPPEPFIIVRLQGGDLETETSPHVVGMALIVCVFDADPNRQGYRDALHIVNEIYRRYATDGVIAGRHVLAYPIRWVTQDEDTHPYYYAGMTVHVELTPYTKEVPFT